MAGKAGGGLDTQVEQRDAGKVEVAQARASDFDRASEQWRTNEPAR